MSKAPPSPPVEPPPAAQRAADSATIRNASVAVAVLAAGAALYWLRGIFTPLALALFLLVMIDGLARFIHKRVPRMPEWGPLSASIAIAVIAFALVVLAIGEYAAGFASQLTSYGPKIDSLIKRLANAAGIASAPSIDQLFQRLNPTSYVGTIAASLQSFVSDAVFVLVYLGFLIASRAGFARKVVKLFPEREERQDAVDAFQRIRNGVERYLWIQTVLGALIAVISFVIMWAVGLDDAFFWAFLIFVAGYIPVIGGAVGSALPPLIALVQFPTVWPAIILLGSLVGLNFVVANVLQPRMQSNSLNLDPVVVLLALAFWGALWGLAGMFLSTPLTVMMMVILAQFKGTEWIAILLSGDGDPLGLEKRHKTKASET